MNLFMHLSRLRLRALLDPFAKIKAARQAWKVMNPLREVLFPVWCPARSRAATITTTFAKGSNSEKLEASRCRPVFLHDQIRPAAIGSSESCQKPERLTVSISRPLLPSKQTRRCAAANGRVRARSGLMHSSKKVVIEGATS
jgi:hypothetical protein